MTLTTELHCLLCVYLILFNDSMIRFNFVVMKVHNSVLCLLNILINDVIKGFLKSAQPCDVFAKYIDYDVIKDFLKVCLLNILISDVIKGFC